MRLSVNGAARNFDCGMMSVLELLGVEGVESPEMVAVQQNGSFVSRENYATAMVNEGDEIEFLYFMGGGKL